MPLTRSNTYLWRGNETTSKCNTSEITFWTLHAAVFWISVCLYCVDINWVNLLIKLNQLIKTDLELIISCAFQKAFTEKTNLISAWIIFYYCILLFRLSGLDCVNILHVLLLSYSSVYIFYGLWPENTYLIIVTEVRAHFKIIS